MHKEFPFNIHDLGNQQYEIIAVLEDHDLFPKYYDLFGKHGYEGNGPCWEGHIEQILERLSPELLSVLDFDSEAGTFRVVVPSEKSKEAFISLLTPIFSNLATLEKWIGEADRDRIDD